MSASPPRTFKQLQRSLLGWGLEVEGGPMFLEGGFLDTVCGIPKSRTEIVMLRKPDGGTTGEPSRFVRPNHTAGSAAMAHELGLPSLAFEVDDLRAVVDQLAADGYRLVGGIGEYEGAWLMAYVWVRRGTLLPWRNGCADPGEFPNVGAIPAQ